MEHFQIKFERDQDPRSPRSWLLRGIYESPLVIVAHLMSDPAEFEPEEAKGTLLDWLGTLEQVARTADICRPVVGCLQIDNWEHRRALLSLESDTAWGGRGLVLYVESDAQKAARRLNRLLFETVDPITIRDDPLPSGERHITRLLGEYPNPPESELLRGLQRLFQSRKAAGDESDIKASTSAMLRKWVEDPSAIPEAPTAPDKGGDELRPVDERNIPRKRLDRLQRVRMCNYRGWCKEREIDVDADLVLLTGPNGFGKSTLLEALAFALTGYSPHSSSCLESLVLSSERERIHSSDGGLNENLIELIGKSPSSERSGRSANDELRIRVPSSVVAPRNSSVAGEEGEFALELRDLPRSSLWEQVSGGAKGTLQPSRIEADLSAVFGADLHTRTEGSSGVTRLLNVFSRGSRELAEVGETLDTRVKELRAEIDRLNSERRLIEDEERYQGFQAAFLQTYSGVRDDYRALGELHRHYEEGKALPEWTAVEQSGQVAVTRVDAFVRALASSLGVNESDAQVAIQKRIERWKEVERSANPEVREKLRQRIAERDRLHAEFPDALERSAAFSDDMGGPALETCLATLSRNLESWLVAGKRFGLTDIVAQLDKVIPSDLRRLSDQAEQHIGRKPAERLRRLDEEIRELHRVAESGKRFQVLARLQRSAAFDKLWHSMKERREYEVQLAGLEQLVQTIKTRETACKAIDSIVDRVRQPQLPSELRNAFEVLLNDLLERVHFVSDLLPASVDEEGRALLGKRATDGHGFESAIGNNVAHGLRIDELSTGQRTQVEVAISVGINLALDESLGSNLLLMDDVSAAQDTSNIAREAVLWRAIAYGHIARGQQVAGEHPETHRAERQRRQLFLSSHNENTSQRLIDLLRPPEGVTMKVIRFVGWTLPDGPKIEVHDVKCTSESSDATRERLAREIVHFLGKPS